MTPRGILVFLGAIAGAMLPRRHWHRLPASFPMGPAAFASGVLTLFAGMAIGIPAFLAHAHGMTSLGLDAELHNVFTSADAGYSQGMVQGFAGLSIFTFLLLTPQGWITLYLVIGGTVRMAAAWFDDSIGDPLLTGVDALAASGAARWRERQAVSARDALEGPEIPDRVVSGRSAGLADCDLVVVASRRKSGWERGTAVLTQDACYRLGEPVERTIAGRLRTLYPLTEHKDHEAIRRSVRYELPGEPRTLR